MQWLDMLPGSVWLLCDTVNIGNLQCSETRGTKDDADMAGLV